MQQQKIMARKKAGKKVFAIDEVAVN